MSLLDERLMGSYGWARSYARNFAGFFSGNFDREELVSVGVFGYVNAAARYDEKKGCSFRAFCALRIRGAIIDELRRQSWEPRCANRFRRLIEEKESHLEADHQRKPTQTELAAALGIAESNLARMRKYSERASCISIDDPGPRWGNGEGPLLPLKDTLPDLGAASPSENVDSAEIRRFLTWSIVRLPSKEASVVILHYLRHKPFCEIAEMMNLTPSRISQLHNHALTSLRERLERKTINFR